MLMDNALLAAWPYALSSGSIPFSQPLFFRAVRAEPYKLTAAQKPLILQTPLHLITCPTDLESLSFTPHTPVSIISRGFTIPTLPPTCR